MRQIISILLSFLMLLSSSGLAYASHYCGNYKMLSKITMGEEHLSCGMKMKDSACGDEHADDHDCCENEYTQVDTDDNFVKASFDLDLQPQFIVSYVMALVLSHPNNFETNPDAFKDYHPPPLLKDVQILYETFLI